MYFVLGYASGAASLKSVPSVSHKTSSGGSIMGGALLTLVGNAFPSDTEVKIGLIQCKIVSVDLQHVVCVTPPHDEGKQWIAVRCNGLNAYAKHFDYSLTKTPVVTNIDPSVGPPATTVTITGTINLK